MFYDLFFFFSSRRRHTRYWRDWSSDVCSSDLMFLARRGETWVHIHAVLDALYLDDLVVSPRLEAWTIAFAILRLVDFRRLHIGIHSGGRSTVVTEHRHANDVSTWNCLQCDVCDSPQRLTDRSLGNLELGQCGQRSSSCIQRSTPGFHGAGPTSGGLDNLSQR